MTLMKAVLLGTVALLCFCTSVKEDPKQRVNHVVLCWLKDSGNKKHRQQLIDESLNFCDIPGVLEVRAGEVIESDRAIVDDSYDVAIFLSYRTIADMDAYIIHPDHKKAVSEVLKPLVKKVLVYDFIERL